MQDIKVNIIMTILGIGIELLLSIVKVKICDLFIFVQI